ncbi:MAG: M18 family aminopeptidase [Clostridia bacterium]|nr:M18 family aminopeptidase [Clostridia bacterium]
MVNKLLEFLKNSPSPFHAVDNLCAMLRDAGFEELCENGQWDIRKGRSYYVTRNLSSLIAFRVPENEPECMLLSASHCDSPVFKIKEKSELEVKGKYIQLDTEKYGGLVHVSWLDRPLSFAGRVLVKTGRGIETRLINCDSNSLIIPNVAPHQKRDINDGMKYNPQTDLVPLYGAYTAKGGFAKHVARLAHCAEEDIVGHDLFLYSRTEPCVWGENEEFLSAERLDDLECAFTSAQGFIKAAPGRALTVLAVFDNEEVGSTTKQGADSTFLTDTLSRACDMLGITTQEYRRLCASSFMLSCDNAHAVHPNHPELYDAVNCAYMNEGIVIKESANQKYTTDGVSKAIFRLILERAGVPVQFFANRSDMIGGGTLGNVSNRHFSLNTVDIGLAQLSMHSTYETAGTKDVQYMIDGVKAFYESVIKAEKDGTYSVI